MTDQKIPDDPFAARLLYLADYLARDMHAVIGFLIATLVALGMILAIAIGCLIALHDINDNIITPTEQAN